MSENNNIRTQQENPPIKFPNSGVTFTLKSADFEVCSLGMPADYYSHEENGFTPRLFIMKFEVRAKVNTSEQSVYPYKMRVYYDNLALVRAGIDPEKKELGVNYGSGWIRKKEKDVTPGVGYWEVEINSDTDPMVAWGP